MMSECVFCDIVANTVAVERIYEDDEVLVFPDSNPEAPVHLLVIPKRHIASLDALTDRQAGLAGKLLLTASQVGSQQAGEQGYRIASNAGRQAEVNHLHIHVLGGKPSLGPIVS